MSETTLFLEAQGVSDISKRANSEALTEAKVTKNSEVLNSGVAITLPAPLETLPERGVPRMGSIEDLDSAENDEEMNRVVDRLLNTQPEEQSKMSQAGEFDVDVVVIGSGPGGYVAAIRAAQLGARTVCIEKEASEWGGTCLNWGCIPTKTMIASVERLHHVKSAAAFGVLIEGSVGFDFNKMMERKTKVVTTLRGGIGALLKSNHVRSVVGSAKLLDAHTVEVTAPDGSKEQIRSKNFILATGSVPIALPIPGLARNPEDKRGESSNGIWTSDEAVYAKECPKRMAIIGTGAVGLEFAYVFRNLGAEVDLIEVAPRILPAGDKEICDELAKSFKKQGIRMHVGVRLTKVEDKDGSKVVSLETTEGVKTIECDIVLMGAGRKPYFEGLGLEAAGVETVSEGPLSRRGVVVDDYLQTSASNIYAIGDLTGKMMLAHLASHMGITAAENIMGHSHKMDYHSVPAPIYTSPEVASVGLTEEQARETGYDVQTGRFPFRPLGRAMALGETEGLVKIITESKYGEILGVHIIGPYATEMIHEAVIAIKLEATVEELVSAIHAHPTLSEAMGEAALDVKGEAIHKLRK